MLKWPRLEAERPTMGQSSLRIMSVTSPWFRRRFAGDSADEDLRCAGLLM